MPELPEVETVRKGLEEYVVGKEIVDVEVLVPKVFFGDKKNVIGAKIESAQRIGKGLIIELDNDYAIAIHLKLTGQLIYRGKETENLKLSSRVIEGVPSKFTCVVFHLKSQISKLRKEREHLYYNDIRKFGWVKIDQKSKIKDQKYFKEMGMELPVISNITHSISSGQRSKMRETVTLDNFEEIIQSSSRSIKLVLMDQKKIGGIGNIYANEALFVAKIDPRRKTNSLSEIQTKKLYEAVIEVLKKGLKYGGASDKNFVNVLGQDGKFQEHFLVYGREGERCVGCKGVVKKIFLGGRGTYFCEKCQR